MQERAKNAGGGLMHEGGGVIAGFYGIYSFNAHHIKVFAIMCKRI